MKWTVEGIFPTSKAPSTDMIKNNFVETCFNAIHKQSFMYVRSEKCSLIIMVNVKIACNNDVMSVHLTYDSHVSPTHAVDKSYSFAMKVQQRLVLNICHVSLVLKLIPKGHFCQLQKPCPSEGVLAPQNVFGLLRGLGISNSLVRLQDVLECHILPSKAFGEIQSHRGSRRPKPFRLLTLYEPAG